MKTAVRRAWKLPPDDPFDDLFEDSLPGRIHCMPLPPVSHAMAYHDASTAMAAYVPWSTSGWLKHDDFPVAERNLNTYLRRCFNELENFDPGQRVAPRVRSVIRELMRHLTSDDTVYPAATPDNAGGINLFWVAGRREVEIEITTDLEIYARVVDSDGVTIANEERSSSMRVEPVKSMLAEISTAVEANTPNWRDHFPV